MPIILESEEFVVTGNDQPHHSRENGGHVVVAPKARFAHRHEMPLDLAAKLMHLSMITGEAMTNVMRSKNINIVRINYQDNANWPYKQTDPKPQVHIHLYARTWHERHPENDPSFQAFPEGLFFPDKATGYYDSFVPLNPDDCADIKTEINRLHDTEKYQHLNLSEC